MSTIETLISKAFSGFIAALMPDIFQFLIPFFIVTAVFLVWTGNYKGAATLGVAAGLISSATF